MDLTSYVTDLVAFANNYIIPFIMGIAFLFFIINVIRFFVIGGSNNDSREKARALALYSILAFVFLLVFWGIVNMLSQSIGIARFGTTSEICFDYDRNCAPGGPTTGIMGNNSGPTGLGGPGLDNFGSGFGGATIGSDDNVSGGVNSPTTDANPRVPGASGLTTPSGTSGDSLPTGDGIRPISESVELVTDAAAELTNAVIQPGVEENRYYDSRTAAVIADSLAAVNDPEASVEARALAATRLNNWNRGSDAQLLTDDEYATYINILNSEARRTGEPEVVPRDLRDSARQPTPALAAQIEFTQSLLLPHFTYMNEWLLDSGAPTPPAVAAGREQLQDVYDPELSDQERLRRLDGYFADSYTTVEEEASLRARFVRELNAERFFRGEGPLDQSPPDCSSGRPC